MGAGGKGVSCWQCKGLVGSFPFVFLYGCGGGLLCVSLQGLGGFLYSRVCVADHHPSFFWSLLSRFAVE